MKHSEIIDDIELHNPKGFASAGNDTFLTKDSTGILAWKSQVILDGLSKNTDFNAEWDFEYAGVDNSANQINIQLPSATTSDIGKSIIFWITSDPSTFKVVFKGVDSSSIINGVNNGVDTVRAELLSSWPSYVRLELKCIAENTYAISNVDGAFV